MCYLKSALTAAIACGVFLLASPADAASSFINSILVQPASIEPECVDYANRIRVGVVIDTSIKSNFTLEMAGVCHVLEERVITPTLALPGHKEFFDFAYVSSELGCNRTSKGTLLLKDFSSRVLSCFYWGAWSSPPCLNGRAMESALPRDTLLALADASPPETRPTPLPYGKQHEADYFEFASSPTIDDCARVKAPNRGQSFSGTNKATSFVNEVIVDSQCDSAVGTSNTGVEVAIFDDGDYTLVMADTSVSPIEITKQSVKGAVRSDWSYHFLTTSGPFSIGYAVLFLDSSNRLLSMVAWGNYPTVIDTADWSTLGLPFTPLRYYYPLVIATTPLTAGSLRVVGFGMFYMNGGDWEVGSSSDCTPKAQNAGQRLAQPDIPTVGGWVTTQSTATDTTDTTERTTDTTTATGEVFTTTTLGPAPGSAKATSLLSKICLAAVIGTAYFS